MFSLIKLDLMYIQSCVCFEQPLLKELQQLPAQREVFKNIKNASAKLLDAFVDSTFKFADQRVLPSQVIFKPSSLYCNYSTLQYVASRINKLFSNRLFLSSCRVTFCQSMN
jgi:hypothetical protein